MTPTQVFSSEYSKILRTHFEKHLQTTTSVNSRAAVFQESLALPFKWNALTAGNFVATHARASPFKAFVGYFHQMFIFSLNDSPSKTMKNVFYFIEKALFVLEIFNFIFLAFPLFLPVGHCFKEWSLINVKACVCYFLSNIYLSPHDSPSKTMKNTFYFI